MSFDGGAATKRKGNPERSFLMLLSWFTNRARKAKGDIDNASDKLNPGALHVETEEGT